MALYLGITLMLVYNVYSASAFPAPIYIRLVNINQSNYPTQSRELVHDCAYQCLYTSFARNSTFCYGFHFNDTGDCELNVQYEYDAAHAETPPIENYFRLLRLQSSYDTCPIDPEADIGKAFYVWKDNEVFHAEFEDYFYMFSRDYQETMTNCLNGLVYYAGITPLTIDSIEENNFIAGLVQRLIPIDNPGYLLPGKATGESGSASIIWRASIPTTVFDLPWASGQPVIQNGYDCILIHTNGSVTLQNSLRETLRNSIDNMTLKMISYGWTEGDENGEWSTASCTVGGICIGKINRYTFMKDSDALYF